MIMQTIKKIEGWLNSNLHDIYSQDELRGFLESILESLKEEQEARDGVDDDSCAILEEQFSHMLSIAETEIKDWNDRHAFDECVTLDLNDNQIDVEVDAQQVAAIVWEDIESNILPNPVIFVQRYKEEIQKRQEIRALRLKD